jgi:hypothetical protein
MGIGGYFPRGKGAGVSRMVELYLHSNILLYDVVLNQLGTGTTVFLPLLFIEFY